MAPADEMKRLRAARLASQLLTGPPAGGPEAVVGHLLAVQAQDGRGARLAVRARSSGLLATDVDRALTVTRSMIVSWLNRGTLHLVAADDYWWLHQLTTPGLAVGNARRLRETGVSTAQAARGTSVVAEAVASDGPLTRAELRQRLDDAGIPTAGQALVHHLFEASLRAQVIRGPMIGNEQGFVMASAWLGEPPPALDADEALGLLARRYLAGHAPAGPRDLARWAGITLGAARRGFAAIGDEVVQVGNDVVVMAVDTGPPPNPVPRLLGPFDPLLHGWASREPIAGTHSGVVTTNGIFRPVALVEGRVVGIWGLPDAVVHIRPLEPIPDGALDALRSEAADVLRFLGLPDRPLVVD